MRKNSVKKALPYIAPILLFAAMIVWLFIAVTNVSKEPERREAEALKINIESGITMCYAVEGVYPESVDYLCDNYGLVYDKKKYIVHYESFASNIRPTVKILERQA